MIVKQQAGHMVQSAAGSAEPSPSHSSGTTPLDEQADTRADCRSWIILVVLLTAPLLTICTQTCSFMGALGRKTLLTNLALLRSFVQ